MHAYALSSSESEEDQSSFAAGVGAASDSIPREDGTGSTADIDVLKYDQDGQQYDSYSQSDGTQTGTSSDELSDLRRDLAK